MTDSRTPGLSLASSSSTGSGDAGPSTAEVRRGRRAVDVTVEETRERDDRLDVCLR